MMPWQMKETAKKDSDGFPVQRLHFFDYEGDRLLAELDACAPAATINTDEFSYIMLSPDQLRRIADWVERAQVKTDAWNESVAGKRYLAEIRGESAQ
ncbi:hypothetical protein [Roseobacter weihaiensis]|uniref:hypothetical protein n=1 Tax=Roseobacter weihaiensis TaxID=2763262 RepID=UPI001D0A6C44|nr:hypothetical protein [Roseobacter sp. H9]